MGVDVFTETIIPVLICCVMASCILLDRRRRFGGTYCLLLQRALNKNRLCCFGQLVSVCLHDVMTANHIQNIDLQHCALLVCLSLIEGDTFREGGESDWWVGKIA